MIDIDKSSFSVSTSIFKQENPFSILFWLYDTDYRSYTLINNFANNQISN